ncbi:MAG: hypothetical protein KF764_18290 [Labilithrix sp.]|nr:hypothetical protein [Labilithrix sp.]MBX3224358.1 hypothetical protein [Labilithrix sp.]
MKDIVIVALLVVAFALVITTHVAIALGLAKRQPRWRAAVALVVPPFAPYWGWQERMRTRVALWVFGLVVYVVMLALASRGS